MIKATTASVFLWEPPDCSLMVSVTVEGDAAVLKEFAHRKVVLRASREPIRSQDDEVSHPALVLPAIHSSARRNSCRSFWLRSLADSPSSRKTACVLVYVKGSSPVTYFQIV